MISVEEIEPEAAQEAPQEAPQEEAVQKLPAPEPEVIEEPAEAEALDIEDAPPEPPKKRGRPKAAPKEKPAPKPKGRPRKVVVPEEPEEVQPYVPPPPPTDQQLHEYVQPLLRLYATHLMRGREGKRAQYRTLFSRM